MKTVLENHPPLGFWSSNFTCVPETVIHERLQNFVKFGDGRKFHESFSCDSGTNGRTCRNRPWAGIFQTKLCKLVLMDDSWNWERFHVIWTCSAT